LFSSYPYYNDTGNDTGNVIVIIAKITYDVNRQFLKKSNKVFFWREIDGKNG